MQEHKWKSYYDQRASMYDGSVATSGYYSSKTFYAQREKIMKWVGPQSGKAILDAGCGVGAFSEPWVPHNRVCGVDISETSLVYARNKGIKTFVAGLYSMPFECEEFDLVVCIGVMQLIEEYRPAITEMKRVTKKGGTILIQTLHKWSLQRKALKILGRRENYDKMYSMAELSLTLTEHGFGRIAFLKQYHPFGMVTHGMGYKYPLDMLCSSFSIKGVKS